MSSAPWPDRMQLTFICRSCGKETSATASLRSRVKMSMGGTSQVVALVTCPLCDKDNKIVVDEGPMEGPDK